MNATAPPDRDEADPRAAARAAKLRYVHDRQPGFRRERLGEKQFRIVDADGAGVADADHLERVRRLAIPPAYEDVWICRHHNGHLQATGRDARGRKQYRYHPQWRAVRDEGKYHRMLVFGRVLSAIRAQVERDLARRGLPREKVLAAVVRLLEGTLVRIGNEEYARQNDSFGLTTLRRRHVRIAGGHLTFDFRGKHGIEHHIDLTDRKLAAIVRRCQELPEQHLFHYLGEDGQAHPIGSDEVNAYLQEITGEDVTAKDFRTWAATNLAALALSGLAAFDTKTKARQNIVAAVESVAARLGNTPAICRKCYIHPAIFDGYLDGTLADGLLAHADAMLDGKDGGLTAEEVAVTAYLRHRLGEPAKQPAGRVTFGPLRRPQTLPVALLAFGVNLLACDDSALRRAVARTRQCRSEVGIAEDGLPVTGHGGCRTRRRGGRQIALCGCLIGRRASPCRSRDGTGDDKSGCRSAQ